jgi:hypothetical protein
MIINDFMLISSTHLQVDTPYFAVVLNKNKNYLTLQFKIKIKFNLSFRKRYKKIFLIIHFYRNNLNYYF